MIVKAYEHISKCAPEHLQSVLTVFNAAALHVCEGQQMDMNYQEESQVSIENYIRMIELKTSTLLAASLKMGAILGGASENQANSLWEFGKNIGIAFQLQDDILDVYGEEGKFGKQVGGDIVAGKKTFLLLKALELGDAKEKKVLVSFGTSSNSNTNVQVDATRVVFDKLNIKTIAQEEVRKYHDEGMSHLEGLDIDATKKELLKKMAEDLLNREI